jgi:predicted metalloprotease with PDZ domain
VTFTSVRRRLQLPAILCLSILLASGTSSKATIQYAVSLDHPEQHLFHVTMTIPEVNREVTVQMPAWNALYQIRDFSSHVQQLEASAGSEIAPIEKLDKQSWRIQGQGTIRIRYATYWDEAGPFATQLNSEHAFINPALILMYVPARRLEDVSVAMPDVPYDWRVATATAFASAEYGRSGSFRFQFRNYDALADAPIEVGRFDEFQLPGIDPEIRVVIHGKNWRKKEVAEDLKRICQYELKLMEGAPYERYTFILHFGKDAGGGMEHANSTAIAVPSDEYLAGVAAHEFFHLWNVKRIRPASLEPVDYTKEQYTRALWFAEGVTNTYASLTLVRSGIWSKDQFYADLGEQISELESRPANRWQSAEQSSLDAWLEKYPLYNQPEYSVSYYAKGQVLGDLLDILIRDRTNNDKSLDDVLRALNIEFAKPGISYRDSEDIRRTVEKIAGVPFAEFFQKYVAGTEPFPYQQTLALAGLDLRAAETRRPTLGFLADHGLDGSLVVRTVDPEGLAAQAALRIGDVITNWNGGEAPRRIERWLREQKPGDLLKIRIRREDNEVALEFKLGEIKEMHYAVSEIPRAGKEARRIRDGLLHGTTGGATIH